MVILSHKLPLFGLKAPKNAPCAVIVIWRHLASSSLSFNIQNDVGRRRHRHKSIISLKAPNNAPCVISISLASSGVITIVI